MNKTTSDCIVNPGLDQSKGFICPAQRLGRNGEVMFGEMVNWGSHKMFIRVNFSGFVLAERHDENSQMGAGKMAQWVVQLLPKGCIPRNNVMERENQLPHVVR